MIDALRFLPRSLRRALVLGRIRLDEERLRGVRVKVAVTRGELFGAARLVHDAYVARGILAPHASRLKVGPQLVVPTTFTFVACAGDEVVGTMALVQDGPLGLPMDPTFRADLVPLRAAGERLAEVSALAIDRNYRQSGLVHALNRLMARTAIALDVDRLIITVHPRARCIYEEALLFAAFGEERRYAGLRGDARAIAMALPVRTARDRYRRAFGDRGAHPSNAAWMHFDGDVDWVEDADVSAVLASEERREGLRALVRARASVSWPAFDERDLAPLRAPVPA